MGILSKIFSSKKTELRDDSDKINTRSESEYHTGQQQAMQESQKNPDPSPFLVDEEVNKKE